MKSLIVVSLSLATFALNAEVVWKNGEWKFRRTDKKCEWKNVNLPHDWAIAGPFDPNVNGGTGKLPWKGTGEYCRAFDLKGFESSRKAGEKYYLEFDGAMARPQVYVNGVLAGGWDYGYMSFFLDVTEFLREGANSLRVTCDTTNHNSRWYPGAGIYREVRLVKRPREHVLPGTLAITTPEVSAKFATVHVAYDSSVRGHVEFDKVIADPRLWDVDDPYLYELELFGEKFRYGIRTFKFTADDGFHLNGRRVQLKGVDLHSDMGPLGMAFDRDVMKRQLLIMKDMGFNALRTSHNAPDPKVLDLCDELGIFVWNECFDKWERTSGRYMDTENLETYVVRNLRQFVRRDRNHPSVFIWSIGNEINPNGWDWGKKSPSMNYGMCAERFREFRAAIRELDRTRPVGIGCCHGQAIATGMFKELDLAGWNYGAGYAPFHKRYPDKPCLYSESCSALSDFGYYGKGPARYKTDYDFKDWKVCGWDHCAADWSDIPDVEFARMEKDRYCCGEFVWTGIDYLGEPTPLWKGGDQGVPKETPYSKLARSSYFGIVDLMGIPKDRYYIYRSYWNAGKGTAHLVPHWNWKDGTRLPVYYYADGDEAELFVNGKSFGRVKKNPPSPLVFPADKGTNCTAFAANPYYHVCDRYRFRWFDIPYAKGEVKAVSFKNGKQVTECVMRTAEKPVAVKLTDDEHNAPEAKTRFVQVDLVDAVGTRDPNATDRVTFKVEGAGVLAAVGNGDPRCHEAFIGTSSYPLFYGKAVAVVRRTGEGRLTLTASVPGLKSSTIEIK